MANIKITDLTAYTDAASTDVLPIVDVSNDVTKKISISTLLKAAPVGTAAAPAIAIDGDPNTGIYSPGADQLAISTGGTGRLFVDASGNISNTAGFNPYATTNRGSLTVNGTASSIFGLGVNGVAAGYLYGDATGVTIGAPTAKNIVFDINGERARIDSSGRLLVGTSTGRNIADAAQGSIQVETVGFGKISITNNLADASGPNLAFGKQRSGSVGGTTIVQNGDGIGAILFGGADGTDLESQGARIEAIVDGTPGANDMPGRLVFSTTADGANSPTERMRIKSNGTINFSNVATYADNAAATSGGLVAGDVYRTSTGQLMIRY
jgi:hypothetical protein